MSDHRAGLGYASLSRHSGSGCSIRDSSELLPKHCHCHHLLECGKWLDTHDDTELEISARRIIQILVLIAERGIMTDAVPEIRFALFGPRGSGKTTFLSSYYGNQQRDVFEKSYGYHIEAEDTSQGNNLLAKYYGLENGEFPMGTESFGSFAFGLKVGPLKSPSIRLVWHDYPGGWWQSAPSDQEERDARQQAFRNLLNSHVGILLIDGERYTNEGKAYVRQTLDQFKNEIRRVRDTVLAEEGAVESSFVNQWIIALSKADTLPPTETAESFCKNIVREAEDQLSGFAKACNSKNFGKHFLLLSSVRGDGNTVADAHSFLGLQLVAPIALLTVLTSLADEQREKSVDSWQQLLLIRIKKLVTVFDGVDNFLPPKYQVITRVLRAIDIEGIIDKGERHYREKQVAAAKKGDAIEAGIAAMNAELASAAMANSYYQNQ